MVDLCEEWQQRFADVLGRRVVFAADEYYLLAGRHFPEASTYGDFPMHEDGIGMARAFEQEFWAAGESTPDGSGRLDAGDTGSDGGNRPRAPASGFFSWVDGAPAEGYRAVRTPGHGANRSGEIDLDGLPLSLRPVQVTLSPGRRGRARDVGSQPIAILTGSYGAAVLRPLAASWRSGVAAATGATAPAVRVVEVANEFFGGNIGVTGLLAGADIAAALECEPAAHRYLLADVCLSGGKFLDGMTPAELPRPVEIVPTNGSALRELLDAAAGVEPGRDTGEPDPPRPVGARQ